MAIEVTTRPWTAGDRELLRTATLANVNWSGEERFTARDVDQTSELRHYTDLRPERGDFGLVAERDGWAAGGPSVRRDQGPASSAVAMPDAAREERVGTVIGVRGGGDSLSLRESPRRARSAPAGG